LTGIAKTITGDLGPDLLALVAAAGRCWGPGKTGEFGSGNPS
jgi:hypothetical protein